MGIAKDISVSLKRAILKVLSKRQAEQALFVKTILLYYLNAAWRRVSMRRGQQDTRVVPVRQFSDPAGQIYFGYYDITPFSKDNQLLLAVRTPKHNAPPKPGETISVGYFDWTSDTKFRAVDVTSTWCWQQGCRLQWLPPSENELVIYNKLVDGRYGCVVQDVRTGRIEREYHSPVYSLESGGRWAVFPNFSRLNRLRPGYGYVDLPDNSQGDGAPADDGIFLLDMETGKAELIVALRDLAALEPDPSMPGAEHYVNHLCFSPSGKKFLFFHLWDAADRSFARLMTCDRTTGALEVIEDKGKVSHYAWRDEDQLLGTFIYENKRAQYQLYAAGQIGYETLLGDRLNRDGHPSYSPDGSLILTDTYADERGDQCLMLIDQRREVTELGRFHSPIMIRMRHHGEARCDLHPRWDRQGKHICFDSAHDGARALYVMDLPREFANRPSPSVS